jgi:GGDEF domain-containing protein
MHSGPPRRRRARPVGDAPIKALLDRLDDVAKGWLLALLEQAPLAQTPAILVADVARYGPALCAAVINALADDTALEGLERGGVLEPLAARTGELAGASSAEATAAAVDALHAVIWQAIRDALPRPDPDQIAELAERLGAVIDLVRAAALHEPEPEAREREGAGVEPVAAAPEGEFIAGRPARGAGPEPAIDHKALWIGAFEEELAGARRTGAHLSLLLAELEDADRLLAVEAPGEASATFGRFAQALRDAVRRQDILVSESESRAWVIARDTARSGAEALADRIASAVSSAPPWRGAPLSATIGVAVLGEDGDGAESLIEVAEEARFAAAASGVAVLRAATEPESA